MGSNHLKTAIVKSKLSGFSLFCLIPFEFDCRLQLKTGSLTESESYIPLIFFFPVCPSPLTPPPHTQFRLQRFIQMYGLGDLIQQKQEKNGQVCLKSVCKRETGLCNFNIFLSLCNILLHSAFANYAHTHTYKCVLFLLILTTGHSGLEVMHGQLTQFDSQQ